jgi:TonB family protein
MSTSHKMAGLLLFLAVISSPLNGGSESTREAPGPGQVPAAATVPQSAAGLQSQLEAILKAATKRDSKRFDDLISDLKVPDNANWFTSVFGDEAGLKLATAYKASWDNYQDGLTNSFRDSRFKKGNVSVAEFSSSSMPPNVAIIRAVLQSAKSPLVVYTATAKCKGSTCALPGLYVYVEGAFRVVNFATFYGLPNVKPSRMRIAGDVTQAWLIHQVNPIPPAEAFREHPQGTIVLHILIDIDGNVKQVDVVSGAPELAPAAVDAVRQWRYKPTSLNGDPVEVDTTVAVNFALGG